MVRSRAALVLLVITLAPLLAAFMPPAGAQEQGLTVEASYSRTLHGQFWANDTLTVTLGCTPPAGCTTSYRASQTQDEFVNATSFTRTEEGSYSFEIRGANETSEARGSVSFGIDRTAPAVTLVSECSTGPTSSGWCRGDVWMNASWSDSASGVQTVDCTADGATSTCSTLCDGPCRWTLTAEGNRTISANATDVAGNRRTNTTVVAIDRTAPNAPLATCTSLVNGWCRAFLTISPANDSVSGIASQTCLVDAGAAVAAAISVPCTSPLSRAGAFAFSSSATDVAGNTGTRAAESFQVDPYAPVLSIATTCGTSGASGWCLAPFDYNMTATDNLSGIAGSPLCRIDGVEVACNGTVTAPGLHALALNATDNAGNANGTTKSFGYDAAAPTISLTIACATPGDDDWCKAGLSATASASDAEGTPTCVYRVDAGFATSCTSALSLAQGRHNVTATATDASGRTNSTTAPYALDTVDPVITPKLACAKLGSSDWCASEATANLTATDATSGLLSLACFLGDLSSPCGATRAVEGQTTIQASARDLAGRTSTLSYTFGVDLTPPAITVANSTAAAIGADGWVMGPVQLYFNGTDALSGVSFVQYSIDGGYWRSAGATAFAAQGDHVYVARVHDRAGNVATSAPMRVRVDNTANPRVLADHELILRPFDDLGLTSIIFAFSEPMDRTSTEAALWNAVGWNVSWGSDDLWLNLTRTDLAPGTTASVTLNATAQGRHGGTLGSPVTRSVVARGSMPYNVTDSTRLGGPAYGFVNITSNGTVLNALYCDDCATTVNLPFPFTFFGKTYTQANVSSNGIVTFNPNNGCAGIYYPDLGWTTCLKNLIAAYWEDLDPRPGSTSANPRLPDRVMVHTIGEAPNRAYVISWSVVHHYSGQLPVVTFQVLLLEGSNDVLVHYETATPDEGQHMLGIANETGERRMSYSWGNVGYEQHSVRYTTGEVSYADVLAPQVTIALDPPVPSGIADWYNTTVNASISATDAGGVNASTFEHSFDGNAWTPGTTVTLPEGETLLRARVRDTAGNLGETAVLLKVDLTPPTVASSNASSGTAGSAWVQYNFSEPMDTASVEGLLENATGWTVAWSADGRSLIANATGLQVGSVTLTLTTAARDAHGVHLAAPHAQTAILDATPPTVVVSGGMISQTDASVEYVFSEPMDATQTLAALENASTWTSWWSPDRTVLIVNKTNVPVGLTILTLNTSTRDANGVRLERNVTHSVQRASPTPPPPPPPTPPSEPTSLAATLSGVDVTLTWGPPAQENGAVVTRYRVMVDGALAYEGPATTYVAQGLARGRTHSFAVTAVNNGGEGPAASTSVAILPTSTLTIPGASPDAWLRTAVLEFTTDPADATIMIDLGAGEVPFGPDLVVPPGEITIRWRATAGGLSEATRETTLRHDPEAPAIGSVALPATVLPEAPFDVTVSVTDAHSGVSRVVALVNGAEVALAPAGGDAYRGTLTLPVGASTIQIVATDAAGNEARDGGTTLTVEPEAIPEEPEAEPDPEVLSGGDPGPSGSTSGGTIPLESTSNGDGGGTPPPTPSPIPTTTEPDTSGAPEDEGDVEQASTDEPAPPPPEIVIDEPTGAGARGLVTVRLTGFPELERVRVVLIAPDGTETLLSEGQEVTEWNTTKVADGYYRIEARLGPAPVAEGTLRIQSAHVGGETLASIDVLVRNDIAPPIETAAIVVGAVAFTAATHAGLSAAAAGASSSASSAAVGGASGFHPLDFLREVAVDASQDKLRDKTKDRAALDRKRRIRSVVAAIAGIVILGALWAFAEVEGWNWSQWLIALPLVGTAAALVTLMKYSSESALAYLTHARPRVRLWVAGTISLALSSIVFRNPFGYPAWVDETGESESKRTWGRQALRAGATIAGAAAFTIPFLALAPWLPWTFVSVGILIALTNLATSSMPFGPLPGKDIWRWNKWAAVGVALVGFAIYVAYAAALAPMWAFWAIGLVGAGSYGATLVYFRRTLGPKPRRVPVEVPVPVRDADAEAKAGAEAVAVTVDQVVKAEDAATPKPGAASDEKPAADRPPRKNKGRGKKHR